MLGGERSSSAGIYRHRMDHCAASRSAAKGRQMYESYQEGARLEPDPTWDDGRISCPRCGHDNTHVNVVRIAARGRDEGPVTWVRVNALSGAVDSQRSDVPDPRRTARQQIALEGFCEAGCVFAYVIRQDHGCTYLDIASDVGDVCTICNDLRHMMRGPDGVLICTTCGQPVTYPG